MVLFPGLLESMAVSLLVSTSFLHVTGSNLGVGTNIRDSRDAAAQLQKKK